MAPTSALDRETLSDLVDASAAINGSLELEATLQAIAESAAVVCRAEAGSVLFLDAARRRLIFRAATG